MDARTPLPGTPLSGDLPKKYIRTFAGDMETVQKGGTPDLAPLEEVKPAAPTTKHPAPQPPPQQSTPLPSVRPNLGPIPEFQVNKPPSPPVPLIQKPPPPLSPVSEVQPLPPPPPLPPEPIRILEESAPLETYTSDFSHRMKETKASTATVLAAEQDAPPPPAPSAPRRAPGTLVIVAGVVLLVVGGFGIYFAYQLYQEARAPVISAPTVPAPIFVETRAQLVGSGSTLMQAIGQSVGEPLAPHTIRLLYETTATSSGLSSSETYTDIFSSLQLPAPNTLLRNIPVEGNMAGVVNSGSPDSSGASQSPFFILSVGSYGETFSAMLSWESRMPHDFAELFPPFPEEELTASSTIATSTPLGAAQASTTVITASSALPVQALASGFRDEVINNTDVRVYRDAAGRSVLLYGYWNQETLVIARNPAAFAEILSRIISAHTQS